MSKLSGYLNEGQLKEFAQQKIEGLCASCRFWEPLENPTWEDDADELHDRFSIPLIPSCMAYSGDCKRHAPTHILREIDAGGDAEAIWPATTWNDWCGDHCEARKEMPFRPCPEPDGKQTES